MRTLDLCVLYSHTDVNRTVGSSSPDWLRLRSAASESDTKKTESDHLHQHFCSHAQVCSSPALETEGEY